MHLHLYIDLIWFTYSLLNMTVLIIICMMLLLKLRYTNQYIYRAFKLAYNLHRQMQSWIVDTTLALRCEWRANKSRQKSGEHRESLASFSHFLKTNTGHSSCSVTSVTTRRWFLTKRNFLVRRDRFIRCAVFRRDQWSDFLLDQIDKAVDTKPSDV